MLHVDGATPGATFLIWKVRLDLEKKLAASSQKFADAARISAQLKVRPPN